MEFPEGMYSIKDTLEEIAENPEALKIMQNAAKLALGMEITPGEGMWDMLKGMSMEDIKEMAGSRMPEGFVESLNTKLIEVKKS